MKLELDIGKMTIAAGDSGNAKMNSVDIGQAIIKGLQVSGVKLDLANAKIIANNCLVTLKTYLQVTLHLPDSVRALFIPTTIPFPEIHIPISSMRLPELEIDLSTKLTIPTVGIGDIALDPIGLKSIDLGQPSITGLSTEATSLHLLGSEEKKEGINKLGRIHVDVPETDIKDVAIQEAKVTAAVSNVSLGPVPIPSIPVPNITSSSTNTKVSFDGRGTTEHIAGCYLDCHLRGTMTLENLQLTIVNLTVSGNVQKISLGELILPLDMKGIDLESVTLKDWNITDFHLKV